MRNVTLLVCLSPSVAPQLITEASFFGLVNPITPVSNLKMVSAEGQLKAFVQVHDQMAATSVVDTLHGYTHAIGKLKVYVSHKKFINYEKRLSEILGLVCTSANGSSFDAQKKGNEHGDSASTSCNMRRGSVLGPEPPRAPSSIFGRDFGLLAKSGEFNAIENKINKNNAKTRILKNSNTDTYQNDTQVLRYNISVTHSNVLELKSRKISEVFGQFGNIVKKSYNSERFVWTIAFDSEESVAAAIAHLKTFESDNYTLVEITSEKRQTPDLCRAHTAQISNCETRNPILMQKHNIIDSQHKQPDIALPYEYNKIALRILDTSQKATAKTVCRMVSRVALPVELLEACDVHAQQFFYIIKFSNQDVASKVHQFMTECVQLMPHIQTTFA